MDSRVWTRNLDHKSGSSNVVEKKQEATVIVLVFRSVWYFVTSQLILTTKL